MEIQQFVAYWVCGVFASIMFIPYTAMLAKALFTKVNSETIVLCVFGWPIMVPLGIVKYINRCIDK